MFERIYLRVMESPTTAHSQNWAATWIVAIPRYLVRTVDLDLFEKRYKAALRPDLLGNLTEKDDWFGS
jgi:hypothetical protein